MTKPDETVLIAGGGIGGLALALTLHQLGVPCLVLESAKQMRPLGVGINLQPNAVRELIDLDVADGLDSIGVRTQEYGFFTKFGDEIWMEPRGTWAGYKWPQYSVHRGQLQIMLFDHARARLGDEAVLTGRKVTHYLNHADHVEVYVDGPKGPEHYSGSLLIGADGLHSAVRKQMVPNEGLPNWGGALLWRGATKIKPFRTGASMALFGHDTQKFVTYTISPTDSDGKATVNWIAELVIDATEGWQREDWTRRASKEDFIDAFADWRFEDVDVPAIVEATDEIFEYPMVDRDPLDQWRDGRVTLMGDAAHIMYPVGSNGASQAIVDARYLGRAFVDHGVTTSALDAYEEELRPATSTMVLRNRSKGPDHVMQIVEERSGGTFDDIDDVMPFEEREAWAANYKGIAGFSIEQLNASAPIIPPGSTL